MGWFLASGLAFAIAIAFGAWRLWIRPRLGRAPRAAIVPTVLEAPEAAPLARSDLLQVMTGAQSFDDFADPLLRAKSLENNLNRMVSEAAMRNGADCGNIAIQVHEAGDTGLLVTFNDSGYALLQKSDGTFKAVTRDVHGRFHEIGNVDPTATFFNKLAGGTGVIVSLAHLISSADLAKSTAKLLDKVNLALALHSIGQYEDLRSYYDRLVILLNRRPVVWSEVEAITLEVAKLRNRLIGEAEHLVAQWAPLVPSRGWWVFGWARKKLDSAFVSQDRPAYKVRRDEYDALARRACLSQACWQLEETCWALRGEDRSMEAQRTAYAHRFSIFGASLQVVEEDLRLAEGSGGRWSELIEALGATMGRSSLEREP